MLWHRYQALHSTNLDGASVMSGKLDGVQALLLKEVPQTICIHYFNHRPNFVVAYVCKNIDVAENFSLQQMYVFESCSYVHSHFIELQR